jgi:hypothetical protein
LSSLALREREDGADSRDVAPRHYLASEVLLSHGQFLWLTAL